MSLVSRRLFLVHLGGAIAALSRSREGASFPDWPAARVDQILTDSPWAKESTVGFHHSGVRTEIFLTIRWASALPVRQAARLAEFGIAGLKEEKAVEQLKQNDTEFIVEIAGFPTTLLKYISKDFERDLMRSAKILIPGRDVISATAVEIPEHGMHRMAAIHFPRVKDLDANDGSIEVRASSGPLSIHQRFKLKEMVYEGRLEL